MTKIRVIVEVSGGVADCPHPPDGVEVIILDWDDLGEGTGLGIEFDPYDDPQALELYLADENNEFADLIAYLESK